MLREALDYNKGLEMEAEKLKKRALMWTWMIENFSIAGAFILCGSLLYALMVKRKLHKSQKTTRVAKP